MITAIVIPADLTKPLALQEIEASDVDSYRSLVGGHLEVVAFQRPAAYLYINEEGQALDLPLNLRATLLAWVHNSAFRGNDWLVGDAVLVGAVKHGEDLSVPEEYVTLLLKAQRFRVAVQAYGDEQWYANDAVFDAVFAAYIAAADLAQRWTQVAELMVVVND
ncbi:hypothetical protein JOF56_003058 [Kibdelosporangium banguiense]|uniref:DUF3846 domain-containing protein n=1 Tax=Kibdelosporangium banguiense TaxID=1365924 RepID=A0ABS4TFM7_9PSEU|nr:DUF3846 domain-containing protein [Kibdelosporangium banguiense]MBP2322673.1 hypothetical protein [Kibdelosporangium banguiense]